jgi:polysaccharide deacetylase 2 family uncharacterized protein YibQ
MRGVGGVSTAFWSIVLLGSTLSIAAGFAGGRSIGLAGALPPAQSLDEKALPPPVRQRIFTRQLVGAHSLDAAGPTDPYGDPALGVTSYARRQTGFDPRRDRARIAVIVIDAGRAGGALAPFVSSPLPMSFAVAPSDDDARATCATVRNAGKSVVIDASSARPEQVAHLVREGATAVIGSLDEDRARALMHAVGRRTLVVDAALGEDDDLAEVARASAHPTLERDVIVDARDVDFMLRDALALAERNGAVIVAIHARTESFDALVRFADRARRDGADVVPLTDIAS